MYLSARVRGMGRGGRRARAAAPAGLLAPLLSAAAPPAPAHGVEIGVTHATSDDLAPWCDAASVARAEALLRERVIRTQNQHIMGFGTLSPEPAPGVYDWSSLDARVATMRATDATPVITLCCAPDWMKGGEANQTNWTNIEVAPRPEHYADFAALSRRVAERYPDILRFQVWNEFKGFWDHGRNRWAYENYTAFYNLVYAELKAANPLIQVGGPYAPTGGLRPPPARSDVWGPWGAVDQRVLDAIEYWFAHNDGADFVCVDGHAAVNKSTGLPVPDELAATAVFSAVTQWLANRTDLPIWWSEIYPLPPAAEAWPISRQVGVFRRAMDEAGGAQVVLTWPAQSTATWTRGTMWNNTCAAKGATVVVDGGYPTAFFGVAEAFNNGTAGPRTGVAAAPAPAHGHGEEGTSPARAAGCCEREWGYTCGYSACLAAMPAHWSL